MKWFATSSMIFLFLQTQAQQLYSDSISVNYFLLDACVITIQLTPEMNKIAEEYGSEQLIFQGFFPNLSSTPELRRKFVEKYHIIFPTYSDYFKKRSATLGATIAPQVVVYDEKEKRILYSGRINDLYAAVGNRRRSAKTHDLRAVLDQIIQQQPIEMSKTQAVGCFINFKE